MKLKLICAAYGLAMAATLGGCVSILPDPAPAPRLYLLEADAQPRFEPLPTVVAIARPNASRALSGRDIAWRRGAELAYIDNAAWEGGTPELLHALLVDTLDRLSVARAIVRVADGSLADFEVRWDLVRFEVDETGDDLAARIEVTVRLLDSASRQVIASQRFSRHEAMNDRSSTVAATALAHAARATMADIGEWMSAQIGADLMRQPNAASSSK